MSKTAYPVLGPAQFWYKGSELGKTHGGIRFRATENIVNVTYDQVGVTPWDRVQTGKIVVAEAAFANLSHALMAALFGGEARIITGGATPACDQVLDVQLGLGISHRTSGGEAIIKPYVGGALSTDVCDWIHLPLTYPEVDMELVFDAETQRVMNARFQALPMSQNNPRLFYLGCPYLLP